MALGARRGGVPSVEMEASFLMPCKGKRRRTKPIHGVAKLAPVEVRSGGKLPPMGILMAVDAGVVLDVIQSVWPRGQMALVARSLSMLS